MTPITDTRPFAEVLADWMRRHNLSAYRVAQMVGARQGVTVTGWRDGRSATYEPARRALMTMVDQGCFTPGCPNVAAPPDD